MNERHTDRGNHKNIFGDAGVEWKEYRYFDKKTVGLDFDGMVEDIKAAPDGSIIVLHGCAHNPTGVDPTKEQWQVVADTCKAKGHLPFFDVAYQVRLSLSPARASLRLGVCMPTDKRAEKEEPARARRLFPKLTG